MNSIQTFNKEITPILYNLSQWKEAEGTVSNSFHEAWIILNQRQTKALLERKITNQYLPWTWMQKSQQNTSKYMLRLLQRLSHSWVSTQFSILQVPPDCSQVWAKAVINKLVVVPQPAPWSICLLPDAQIGETHFRSVSIWWGIPWLLQSYFCFWMDATF